MKTFGRLSAFVAVALILLLQFGGLLAILRGVLVAPDGSANRDRGDDVKTVCTSRTSIQTEESTGRWKPHRPTKRITLTQHRGCAVGPIGLTPR